MSRDVCTLVYLGIIFVTYTLVYKNLVYCHQFKDKIITYKIGMRVSNTNINLNFCTCTDIFYEGTL